MYGSFRIFIFTLIHLVWILCTLNLPSYTPYIFLTILSLTEYIPIASFTKFQVSLCFSFSNVSWSLILYSCHALCLSSSATELFPHLCPSFPLTTFVLCAIVLGTFPWFILFYQNGLSWHLSLWSLPLLVLLVFSFLLLFSLLIPFSTKFVIIFFYIVLHSLNFFKH